MGTQATGSFCVTLTPQEEHTPQRAMPQRLLMDKQFRGDLEGASTGQMLSAMGMVQGSAGYVAIENVTGTLHGRKGSFVLQHSATMNRGIPHLKITVVPDSGTGELMGLQGTMHIIVADGTHLYEFEYALWQRL